MKKEKLKEAPKKRLKKSTKDKERKLNPVLLTDEQKAFLEKEEKIDKVNERMNRPIIATYICAFIFVFLIGYLIRFMVVDRDEVIANSANPRLNSYAENVNRGDIKTSDGKVVATGDKDDRKYPYDELFAHVVGYSKYTKAGIERIGNYHLTDSHANALERLFHTLRDEKNEGDTVVATLNYDIQKTAYDALGEADGAVVVMEPDTGKILAMVSKPDFDPNDIDTVWEEANSEGSTSSVLLNRASQGLYAPGSTFKILTTLAYMRQHPIDFNKYEYDCESDEKVFNGVSVHCYGRKTHGHEDIETALANSCNQVYADLGTKLNLKKWREMLDEMMFNQSLPYADSCADSRFVLDENSNSGYVPQTAFGQGDTLITPLHNALIVSTIANGGMLMKPYLIDRVEDYNGNRVHKFSPSSYKTLMSSKEVDTLTEYMRKVVTDGTASPYFDGAEYEAAGKTGTAEYANGQHDLSWFVGFSNPSDPDVVVSVVVEQSDVNGVKASAVARQIFDQYYRK